MTISFDKALGVHGQALALRARRAELLATNLANSDTPNYKARDLDFRAALSQAQGAAELKATQPGHIGHGAGAAVVGGSPLYRVPTQASVDGNTVDDQVEKAAFAENAVHYQATLQLLGGRIRTLMSALRGE